MKSSYLFVAILISSTISAFASSRGAKTGWSLLCVAIALLALMRVF